MLGNVGVSSGAMQIQKLICQPELQQDLAVSGEMHHGTPGQRRGFDRPDRKLGKDQKDGSNKRMDSIFPCGDQQSLTVA